jgi:hypothetical protein
MYDREDLKWLVAWNGRAVAAQRCDLISRGEAQPVMAKRISAEECFIA